MHIPAYNKGGKLTSRLDLIADGHEEPFFKDLMDDLRARDFPNSTSAHNVFLATPHVAILSSDEQIAVLATQATFVKGAVSCWGCPIDMESWIDIQSVSWF